MFSNSAIFNIFVLTLMKYIYKEDNQVQKVVLAEKKQLNEKIEQLDAKILQQNFQIKSLNQMFIHYLLQLNH
jgi:hypothetical protein